MNYSSHGKPFSTAEEVEMLYYNEGPSDMVGLLTAKKRAGESFAKREGRQSAEELAQHRRHILAFSMAKALGFGMFVYYHRPSSVHACIFRHKYGGSVERDLRR